MPSFETLARSVTQDVHPRTLLEELCRLGLAEHDERRDRVRLLQTAFVPRRDQARMFGFLGDNVADHFAAAVANVQGDGTAHFEQAIFADELSSELLAAVRTLTSAHWQQLLEKLVPQLESMIAADAQAGRTADQRLSVGLYSYHEDMAAPPAASEECHDQDRQLRAWPCRWLGVSRGEPRSPGKPVESSKRIAARGVCIQWLISTGRVIDSRIVRVTPPSTISRARWCA